MFNLVKKPTPEEIKVAEEKAKEEQERQKNLDLWKERTQERYDRVLDSFDSHLYGRKNSVNNAIVSIGERVLELEERVKELEDKKEGDAE